MFGKGDLVDSLTRDLARARDKRDALASDVTTLTAQIAELEARLSAENDRRERERAASEVEGIKKQIRDRYLTFVPIITGFRDATEMAVAIVPEAREFNELLLVIATEVASAIDGILGNLDRRIEALRAGDVAPELPQSLDRPAESPQNNDRLQSAEVHAAQQQPERWRAPRTDQNSCQTLNRR
jgi:hypothetical protein